MAEGEGEVMVLHLEEEGYRQELLFNRMVFPPEQQLLLPMEYFPEVCCLRQRERVLLDIRMGLDLC
jgi:hypothetical protein